MFKVRGFSLEAQTEVEFETQKEAIEHARFLIGQQDFFKAQVYVEGCPTPKFICTKELSRA